MDGKQRGADGGQKGLGRAALRRERLTAACV